MKSAIVMCLVGSVLGWSSGLKDFQPGQPARALEINDNFRYLDSAVQKKASQAGVDALAGLVNTKADGYLRDSLVAISARIRRDSAAFAAYQTKLREDSAAQAGKVGQLSSDLGAKADASTLADFKAKIKRDSASTAALISGAPTSANIASKLDAATFNSFQSKVKTDSSAVAGQLGNLQSTVSGMPTAANIASKLDAATFDSFQSKVKTDSSAVAGQLGSLQSTVSGLPTAASLALKLDASESPRLVRIGDAAHLSRVYFNSTETDEIDGGTWYGMGRSNIPSLSISPNLAVGAQMQVAGYFGLRLRSGGHALDLPEANTNAPTLDGKEIWHAGNLSPESYAGNRGATAFTDLTPPVGSWYADIGSGNIPGAHDSRCWNIQSFSTGNSVRGLQIAGCYSSDDYAIRRGSDGWQPWVALVHSGNFKQTALDNGLVAVTGATITGDLRITGKLTTTPGATPADYVFEPDYKLAPLAEVEAYTKTNKHLPEVPSAAEMTTQGVDVAAMNMILLKKVEELTLHAIEQQKLLDAQRSELVAQKQRLDRLEAR